MVSRIILVVLRAFGILKMLCPLPLALLESSWVGKWIWGLVTAVIGDVAAIFGCCLGIKVHLKGKWDFQEFDGLQTWDRNWTSLAELGDWSWEKISEPLRQAMGTAITFVALGVTGPAAVEVVLDTLRTYMPRIATVWETNETYKNKK